MHLPRKSLSLPVVGSLLVCAACTGCEAQRPPAADGLAKACAQCDSRGMLDGASCYAKLAEKLLGEGKRGLADAKLNLAGEKMAAALAEEGHAPGRLIDGLAELSSIQFKVGHRGAARTSLQQALGLIAKVETPREKSAALIRIAISQFAVRETSAAFENLKQAESLAAEAADTLTICDLLGQTATCYAAAGRQADADRLVQQALAKARSEADPVQASTSLASVAVTLEYLERRQDATSVFAEARQGAESVPDSFKRAVALGEVGKRLYQSKRPAPAHEVLVAALQLLTQTKDQSVAKPLRDELTLYVQKCNQAN